MSRVNKSPKKEYPGEEEEDQFSSRIKDLLRADLQKLEDENALLKTKCIRMAEL